MSKNICDPVNNNSLISGCLKKSEKKRDRGVRERGQGEREGEM